MLLYYIIKFYRINGNPIKITISNLHSLNNIATTPSTADFCNYKIKLKKNDGCTYEQILFDIWSTEPEKRLRHEKLPGKIAKNEIKTGDILR